MFESLDTTASVFSRQGDEDTWFKAESESKNEEKSMFSWILKAADSAAPISYLIKQGTQGNKILFIFQCKKRQL